MKKVIFKNNLGFVDVQEENGDLVTMLYSVVDDAYTDVRNCGPDYSTVMEITYNKNSKTVESCTLVYVDPDNVQDIPETYYPDDSEVRLLLKLIKQDLAA